jgi:hypothetical protein
MQGDDERQQRHGGSVVATDGMASRRIPNGTGPLKTLRTGLVNGILTSFLRRFAPRRVVTGSE